MTNQSESTIERGLLAAVRAEHEGFHFYSMAAESTKDEKGREIFLTLADDERRHAEFLKAQLESIKKTGRPDMDAVLGAKTEYTGQSPIFSEGIRARIATAHYEMTALSVGIQLELDAIKHYKQLADRATDTVVNKFFLDLAEWESEHYRALLDQQEVLKEDYWSSNGFSPM
jgi:rubrerythrin